MQKKRGDIKFSMFITLLGISVFTITFCFVLPACRNPQKTGKHPHKANINYAKLFSRLQGTWISYEYILNLKKTTSPSESAAFTEGIFSFAIDSNRLEGDTLHCTALLNGRAERNLWIAFDSPDSLGQYNIGITKQHEENDGQSQNAENITHVKIDSPFITIYTSTFDSVRYIYYANLPLNTPADYALKNYTTSTLFRGEYFVQDPDRIFGSSHIYFSPQNIGKIEGSAVYDSFDINIGLLAQNDSIQNYLELFDSRKQNESVSYRYSIKKNILYIYPGLDSLPFILRKIDWADTLPRP